jgi:transposase
MSILVTARHNPDMRDKYTALINLGKPQKVVLTTVMQKLIELANTLVNADREWASKGAWPKRILEAVNRAFAQNGRVGSCVD